MMSALFTGATGLRAYGEGMSSISHNLANTNTIGFKSAMMLYQDLGSQSVPGDSYYEDGVSMPSQVGKGVSVMTNRTMFFQQGGFEPGNTATDMGISGKGFFGVTRDGVLEYTRAGNFRFTSDGELVDPNGFTLMGNPISNGVTSATAEPIVLNLSADGQTYMAPKATSSVTLVENLGSTVDSTADAENPYFSLAKAWNGNNTPPLTTGQYSHRDSVPVYDAEGNQHNLDLYYDYVGAYDGKKVYEYVVGSAASGGTGAGAAGNGLFGAGTMTFSSSGELLDMTLFQAPPGGSAEDLSAWQPAAFGADGKPTLTTAFIGSQGTPLPAQTISLDLGLQMNGAWSADYASAADVAANPSGLFASAGRERNSASSTAYDGSSATALQQQDGYTNGTLTNLSVSTEGVMSGQYSNGETMELYRIPLYRFISEDGLYLEGGNHYSQTLASGPGEAGFAGTENFGQIIEERLEQSTVDMAKEFTNMVVTQRGFQMNSKVVTTSDQMLQKALELKR